METRLFVQQLTLANIKSNTNALRGKYTGDWWILLIKGPVMREEAFPCQVIHMAARLRNSAISTRDVIGTPPWGAWNINTIKVAKAIS